MGRGDDWCLDSRLRLHGRFLKRHYRANPSRCSPQPLVNNVASGKGFTVMKVSLLSTEHLIVSMLFHGPQAPDNPVLADSLTPLHRVLPHESD